MKHCRTCRSVSDENSHNEYQKGITRVKAQIHVTLKNGILDPQGKTIHHALETLGFSGVTEVRTGKLIEMTFTDVTRARAQELVEAACQKLLANPVIENYRYTLAE